MTIDDDEDDLGTDIRMHEELEPKKWKTTGLDIDADGFESSSQALERTREGVQPSVHMSSWKRHSYQLGTFFLQLSVLDLHSTFGVSCFWNLKHFFFQDARRLSADVALCGMGSVRSTSRGVALDIWPLVVAWRWQSDAASLEIHRVVLVLHSWWTFTARR